MTFTTIPSIKGQITIPPSIRKKYKISKNTPIKVEDKGNGTIYLTITTMVDYDDIQYFENDQEASLSFPKGVDPQILIDKIKEIDG